MGIDDWTLQHAFFANMGGFVLRSPDYQCPFPIDAEQLLWLIKHGYLPYPQIEKRAIDDKNKADSLTRYVH